MSEAERPLILIADDDPEIRRILQAHLATMQCDIIEAFDGENTLEQVIINKPDLIVLDVMMPELNGWEICKYVKTHDEYAHLSLIHI